ncbi:unnamed protein product [Calypogeia fissa]
MTLVNPSSTSGSMPGRRCQRLGCNIPRNIMLDSYPQSRTFRTSNYISRAPTQGDRFIPIRSAMDLDIAHFNLSQDTKDNLKSKMEVASPLKEEYKRKLAQKLFHDSEAMVNPKILAFKTRAVPSSTMKHNYPASVLHPIEDAPEAISLSPTKFYRRISPVPERVLDAPELVDDYYLNLLDWSCKNVVAVALGTTVYLWHADTGAIHQLMSTYAEDDYITSVAWTPNGEHIALGFNNKELHLWDATRCFQVRRLKVHSSRVGSLAWNGSTLSSGGRDSKILNHDVRIRDHLISQFMGHSQEVCGLKWAPSGQQLASGGNDNLLHIWDLSFMSSSGISSNSQPSTPYLHRLDEHQAAVKALAWCPFQSNLLASGGGTADRCIKFWNTQTGSCIDSVDTYSQVCALQWSKYHKEILSSHGFSQNQLCVWKYPSMLKLAELIGHTARVLHLAQSPDGTSVVSAAADETLRFWKVFGSPPSNKQTCSVLSLQSCNIR